MTKKTYEEEAKNRFPGHIERERGERWEVFRADVVTDPKVGTNFDYELHQGSRRIALEIMRLVDSKGLAEFQARNEIISAVLAELKKQVPKDRDFIFYTPSYFKVSKDRRKRKQFVRDLVAQLVSVAKSCTRAQKVRFRGYPYTVSPYQGSGWVTSACNLTGGYPDLGEQLIESILQRKLPHKNRQLSVAGYERIVLIVCLEGATRTEDFQEAISNIDFSYLPNIDKVYFESGLEQIHLVYDRLKSDFTPGGGSGQFPLERSEYKYLQILLDLLDEYAIIDVCQLGWSTYRFPRLKHPPLIIAPHPLNPLLAALPRNRSNFRPHRSRQQLIARSSSAALTPLLTYRLQTPTS